jgi:hypothetical protein
MYQTLAQERFSELGKVRRLFEIELRNEVSELISLSLSRESGLLYLM